MPTKTSKRSASRKTTKKAASRAPKKVVEVVRSSKREWKPSQPILKVFSRRYVDPNKVNDITVALVLYESGEMGLGVSKRNPADVYDAREGVRIAVQRAQPFFDVQQVAQDHFNIWAKRTLGTMFSEE